MQQETAEMPCELHRKSVWVSKNIYNDGSFQHQAEHTEQLAVSSDTRYHAVFGCCLAGEPDEFVPGRETAMYQFPIKEA